MMSNFLRIFLTGFLICIFIHQSRQEINCLAPDWFKCKSGRCISHLFVCDREPDCDDEADEENCESFVNNSTTSATISSTSLPCAEGRYPCKNNECIPMEKFCDNIIDCSDSTDEYPGCIKDIKCDDFRCKDGHCIKHEWVCDGLNDCLDGSDEYPGCTKNVQPTPTLPTGSCAKDEYRCKNGECIPLEKFCDGINDCVDSTDEYNGCIKDVNRDSTLHVICKLPQKDRTPGISSLCRLFLL